MMDRFMDEQICMDEEVLLLYANVITHTHTHTHTHTRSKPTIKHQNKLALTDDNIITHDM